MLHLLALIVALGVDRPCGPSRFDGVILAEWRDGENAVVVCGGPQNDPGSSNWQKIDDDTWEGESLSVFVKHNSTKRLVAATDHVPIRVSVKLPRLVVTEHIYDCKDRQVPWIETTILFEAPDPLHLAPKVKFAGRPWNEERAGKIVEDLAALKGGDDRLSLLCELRDMGLQEPEKALPRFRSFEHATWHDGHAGEESSGFLVQLERALEVKQHRAN